MKGLALSALAGITGVLVTCLLVPTQPRKSYSPPPRPDNPHQGSMFRAYQRLSEDGTIPTGALGKAMRQRADLPRLESRGGVSPVVWQSVGPTNVGGRLRAIVVDPTNANVIYVGSASGGIWKTSDGGSTWKHLDDFMDTLAIGCMVMHPTNSNTLYAGTGEGFWEVPDGDLNTSALRGNGIYVSNDAGATWNQMPSTDNPDFYGVTRLAFSPSDPNIMIATTTTGVWRTTNGGASWSNRLAEHAYDVDFHPTDGSKVLCGVHDDGVFFSNDGGVTWTRSTSISAHRTEIAYARSNPSIVYATASANENIRLWKSTNGGTTFTLQGATAIGTYEAYNNALWVDPTNPNGVLYGGVQLYRSTNGGTSRSQVFSAIHPDHHVLVEHPQFNGTTNRIVFSGHDGGINRINDYTGTSQTRITNGLVITQFYGAIQNPISGRILGGTQDNYTQLYSGNPNNWTQTFGGDGGFTATDPTNQNYFWGTIYWARHFRSTNGGTSASEIWNTANPIGDANIANQVNFENYLYLDPNNPNVLFSCCQRLWRTTNAKATAPDWFSIKPATVAGRPGKGSGLKDPPAHFNPVNPLNISTMVVAKGNSDIIWVGHNNGQIFKTSNGTATNPSWTRVDAGTGLPDRWVSRIVLSPTNTNEVYVSFMGWTGANIWKSTNGGSTWTDLATGRLPEAPVSALAVHPANPGWLYAGGDLGLFVSMDDGATWTVNNQGPAVVPIEELNWKDETTLMAVTHGRGIWLATITGAEDVVSPDSYSIPFGTYFSGRYQDCLTADDYRLDALPTFAGSRTDAQTQFEFVGKSHYTSSTELTMTAEASCDLLGVDYALALFNHTTGQWEEFSRQASSTSDATIMATVPNPNRFISASGQIRGRVRFYLPPTAPRVVHGRVDVAYWRVKP